jgi:O-antigen/teichoic acid export membrane protein
VSGERREQPLLGGTIRVFLAEALLFPTGLVTAMFLTRHLGPAGYGLFALAATAVAWLEWTAHSLFTRATIKFVGEAEQWRPVGDRVLRLHLAVGGSAALLVWLLAPAVAAAWREPELAGYLRLLAFEIPLVCASYAHRDILVGRGSFRERALASAGRWTARLVLILALVGAGLSVRGAILGCVGAAAIELALLRRYVKPSALRRSAFPSRRLFEYAAPIFLAAVGLRLLDKLDLFALATLGASAEQAGFYGAAQNMALVPSIFALSFSPLVLARIARLLAAHDEPAARRLARNALRLVIALVPLASALAACATELVRWVYGPRFAPAGPVLAVLIFAGMALLLISAGTAILVAAGRPRWPLALTAPLTLVAAAGHWAAIPSFGPIGAAAVTTATASLGALATVVAVHHLWGIAPPAGVCWRSALVSALVYGAVAAWGATGARVLLELAVAGALVPAAFWLLGELNPQERADLRAGIRGFRPREA